LEVSGAVRLIYNREYRFVALFISASNFLSPDTEDGGNISSRYTFLCDCAVSQLERP